MLSRLITLYLVFFFFLNFSVDSGDEYKIQNDVWSFGFVHSMWCIYRIFLVCDLVWMEPINSEDSNRVGCSCVASRECEFQSGSPWVVWFHIGKVIQLFTTLNQLGINPMKVLSFDICSVGRFELIVMTV